MGSGPAGPRAGQPPEQLLAAARERALERLTALEREYQGIVEASRSANADDEHDPEGATIAFERQHVMSLRSQAQQQLADIDAATRRLSDGTYGRCQRCGRPIAPERLAARPTAVTCVSCAAGR
ncbi:MAG: TraR/DksA family transcriptional regulator [Streptosporangiaceae bacterium]